MAYKIDLQLPGDPSQNELEAALEAVTAGNTRWYLEQWGQGRDPPCCCGCAEVAYRADPPSSAMRVWGLPYAFSKPHVSCHTAASVHAGRSRAVEAEKSFGLEGAIELAKNGLIPAELVGRHHVRLRWTAPQGQPARWHAYYSGPLGLVDVTGEMKLWGGS